jgi:preprotein translocase subunit SecA
MFQVMLAGMRETVTAALAHIEIELDADPEGFLPHGEQEMYESRMDPALMAMGEDPYDMEELGGDVAVAPVRTRQAAANMSPDDPSTWGKVPRNAPCPCGSGKKYKHCHGKV